MAVDIYFDPPTIQIPSLMGLREFYWEHIEGDLCHAISQEYQYLCFHLCILENAKYTAAGQLNTKPWERPLNLSVRAGAVKAALLICASIAEAALRYIAEEREYPLHRSKHKRTFGNVLNSWKGPSGGPRNDVRAHWKTLKELHNVRNNIHLFKAASDPNSHFEQVLNIETDLLPRALQTLEHISSISP